MRARLLPLRLLLVFAAAAGCDGARQTQEDYESELADSLADSFRSVVEASEAGAVGLAFAAGGSPACAGDVEVLGTAPLCSTTHPSQVRVTWSCTGPEGNGLTGTADVETSLVPDACPPSQLATDQTLTLQRRWRIARIEATLAGTADLAWTNEVGSPPSSKSIDLALEHRVHRAGELLRHQILSGSRTVALDENGPGELDDSRVVDGTVDVSFVLAGVDAMVTETDLTFRRTCCHPLSGSIAYALTGSAAREGEIVFGPECGAAKTDEGRPLELAPCIAD